MPNKNNVVIVTTKRTTDQIVKTKVYLQQLNLPFKNKAEYIAFYVNKKIVGYGKIIKIEEYTTHREYQIERFIEINIPHLERGTFIRFRRYTSIDKLTRAITTKDL